MSADDDKPVGESAPERRSEANRSSGRLIGLVPGPLLAGGLLALDSSAGCSPAAWATAAAAPYANPLVFLFLGGFPLVTGVQRHDPRHN